MVVERKCDSCIYKEITSEAELYCASGAYGSGKEVKWCSFYDSPIGYMISKGFDAETCEKYDFDDSDVINQTDDFYD